MLHFYKFFETDFTLWCMLKLKSTEKMKKKEVFSSFYNIIYL